MNDTALIFKLDLADEGSTVIQNISNHSLISLHPGMPRNPVEPLSVGMKSPTSSQGTVLFRSSWDWSLSWGLKAEREKKD
jgi:hypothetical protein